jgi:hypothetical protein
MPGECEASSVIRRLAHPGRYPSRSGEAIEAERADLGHRDRLRLGVNTTFTVIGVQGGIRHETTAYQRGMTVSMPPPSVLVAYGIATSR